MFGLPLRARARHNPTRAAAAPERAPQSGSDGSTAAHGGSDDGLDNLLDRLHDGDGGDRGSPITEEPNEADHRKETGDVDPLRQALVERARGRDVEAFGEIYDLYVGAVYRYVYHRTSDRSLAEDLTGETFLRAWRRIDTFTWQGRDIGAWLVRIARNLLFDHTKSSRYRLEMTTADVVEPAGFAERSTEDQVLAQDEATQLMAGIKMLSGEQQECLVLRFFQGLSVAETAAVMGKNEGAIKALQHRAVRRLAALLPAGMTPP